MDAYRSSLEAKDGKLFSKVLISSGTTVFEVSGDVVPRGELSKYPQDDINQFFQINKDLFISKSGDLDDSIGHSCNPNCALKVVGHRALVVTLYQINANVELTLDYSLTSTDSHESWKMTCNCGDYNCRKIISGFNYLSEDQKQTYIKLGIVPEYVK